MTATASKVNASIARHSLSVPPGGTISPRSTILAIKGPKVAIPRSQLTPLSFWYMRALLLAAVIAARLHSSKEFAAPPGVHSSIRLLRNTECTQITDAPSAETAVARASRQQNAAVELRA